MLRKTTTKTTEHKIIKKHGWLKFKVEEYQDVPSKHWWASPRIEKTTCFVIV